MLVLVLPRLRVSPRWPLPKMYFGTPAKPCGHNHRQTTCIAFKADHNRRTIQVCLITVTDKIVPSHRTASLVCVLGFDPPYYEAGASTHKNTLPVSSALAAHWATTMNTSYRESWEPCHWWQYWVGKRPSRIALVSYSLTHAICVRFCVWVSWL